MDELNALKALIKGKAEPKFEVGDMVSNGFTSAIVTRVFENTYGYSYATDKLGGRTHERKLRLLFKANQGDIKLGMVVRHTKDNTTWTVAGFVNREDVILGGKDGYISGFVSPIRYDHGFESYCVAKAKDLRVVPRCQLRIDISTTDASSGDTRNKKRLSVYYATESEANEAANTAAACLVQLLPRSIKAD